MMTTSVMGEYRMRMSDDREFGPVSMETIQQWARQGRVPFGVILISENDGAEYAVHDFPELARIVQAPPTESTGLRYTPPSSPHAMIPTANPHALIGYYIAVASLLLPILAPVAIILGIIGLRNVSLNPEVKGTAHGWVAIVGGAVILFGWIVLFAFLLSL